MGKTTLQEKEKLLVSTNFSFSHSGFKGLVLQTCKNHSLFGKGLRDNKHHVCVYHTHIYLFQQKVGYFSAIWFTTSTELYLNIFTLWNNKIQTLTHHQTTNFRLFQTVRVCRRQLKNLTKMAESYPNG